MLRAIAALLFLALAAPAAALGYVPGDPNVPVFSALGPSPPSAETPTNFGMVQAAPIALPSRQAGPAVMNQSITGSVSGNVLTLDAAPSGGDLPISTQIINSTVGGCGTNANCPVVTAETDSTHYTLSQTNASPTSLHIAITTQPLGAFEDAIVGWDSQLYQNFDSRFASSCLSAHAIGVPSLGDISHVDFHLDGGVSGGSLITATATTINSDTGMPEFCWAAPVSLFAGHNGTHQVDAVVWPVAGWPVVMQSAQPVSMPASSNTATVPSLTPSNNTIPGSTTKLFFVTNSSDTATFPNTAMSSTAIPGAHSFLAVYCVIAGTSADTFQLEEGSYSVRPNHATLVSTCNIQVTGTADGVNPTVTVTGSPTLQPGGTPIVGQKISGSGLSGATITGIAGNVLTVSAIPTITAGATFTISGAIPATASGATFTMTPLHAGGSFEQPRNQNMGSFFFTANPPGTANTIPEITGYAANTGSPSNPATQSLPTLTLTQALKAVTPTNAYSVPFTSLTGATTQSIGNNGACTTFLKTGNSSGSAPYPLNYPVKYDAAVASSILLDDTIYFVKDNATNGLATDTMTLSAVPNGPCINDPVIANTGATCVPNSINCINLWADYSFTTLKLQCIPSGPITCDDGHPALFALGDGGALNRFARLGLLTVGRDPANSTFDNVVINSEGSQGTSGSNSNSVGLGVESVHMLSIKNVIPTVTLPLLQPILSGQPITSILVDTATLVASGFPIILPSGSNGSENTQLIDGGNCIPASGNSQFGGIGTVTVSSMTTVGSTTVLNLVASPTTRVFNAFNGCPVGTPITLQNNWSYIGGVNFWFDQSLMQSPYALTIGPSGTSQIARGWTGSQTATGSTTVKLGQPYNLMDRVANSQSIKAASKGMTNAWMITNSLIDQGGDQAVGNYNQVGNFFGYGLSAPEVDDFATINGSVSGATLTVNSVSSGAVSPYMLLTYTGQPAGNGLFIDSQINATQFSLNGGGTAITNGTITLHRSIWKIGPPLNTTPGNTFQLPEMNLGGDAYWFCTGFATSGIATALPYFDKMTSTVILAGGPGSSSGPTCPLDGNSYLTIHTGDHEDMQTVGGGLTGAYLTGLIIDGLTVQNSQGYGIGYLAPVQTVAQNMFVGHSNVKIYRNLAGQVETYADLSIEGPIRNGLFQNNAFNLTKAFAGSVVNGSLVFDGVNCGGNPAFWTNLGATIPGIVIRNTNWPNMLVGAPAGTC